MLTLEKIECSLTNLLPLVTREILGNQKVYSKNRKSKNKVTILGNQKIKSRSFRALLPSCPKNGAEPGSSQLGLRVPLTISITEFI